MLLSGIQIQALETTIDPMNYLSCKKWIKKDDLFITLTILNYPWTQHNPSITLHSPLVAIFEREPDIVFPLKALYVIFEWEKHIRTIHRPVPFSPEDMSW